MRYNFAVELTDEIADYICYGRRAGYYVLLIDTLASNEALQEKLDMTTSDAFDNFLVESRLYLKYFGIKIDDKIGIRGFLDEFDKKLAKQSIGNYNAYMIGRARYYLCVCNECEIDEEEHNQFMRTSSRLLSLIPEGAIDNRAEFYRFLCSTLDIPDESFAIMLLMYNKNDEESDIL